MLGFPLVYFKGMRLMMFQLSGFYYNPVIQKRASSIVSCEAAAQRKQEEEIVNSSSAGLGFKVNHG